MFFNLIVKIRIFHFILLMISSTCFSACFVEKTSAPKNGLNQKVEETRKLPSALSDSEGMKGAECHFVYSESKCKLPDKSNEESIKYYGSHYIRCGVNLDLSYSYSGTGQYLYELRDVQFIHAPDKKRPVPVDLAKGIDFAEDFSFYATLNTVFDDSNSEKISDNPNTNFNESDFYITHKRADKKNPNGKWVCEICSKGRFTAKSCDVVNDTLKRAN